jgi:serine/threonine protein kinase
MEPERDLQWVLDRARQLPPASRKALLDEHCADDPEIRAAIETLLGEEGESDELLKPGGALSGPLLSALLAEPSELLPGTRLGPYEITAPLGAGGMGEVYRAHDTRLGRDVAIKILPAHSAGKPEALARFEREARAVAALSHPNILAIHDVGSDGDVQFVVTELLEGESLRSRIAARRALPPGEAVHYGIQIARGLAAAHERGIIHRDLKPDNIFVTRDGRVKILDFGIALYEQAFADADDRHTALTRTGLIVGTVGYVSPEQTLGQPASALSDVFAFGVVLYEMLTGQHPFGRATAPEMQTAVLREDPLPLERVAVGVPASIVRLIGHCLNKQPERRPQSAGDLALFLEALNDKPSLPTSAHDVSAARPWRVRLVAAIAAFLVLLTAPWLFIRQSTERSVGESLADALSREDRTIRRLHDERGARLALTARLIGSFPELRALFATDVATIRDFLLGYQQRVPGLATLIAVAADGTIVARTDEASPSTDRASDWIEMLVASHGQAAIVGGGTRPSVAVAAPLEAAGTVFGYLVAAEPLDQRVAETFSEATQDDVVLLDEQQLLASTLRAAQIPWRSLDAWRQAGGRPGSSMDVEIGGQSYAAHEVDLGKTPAVSAIIVKSRDEAFVPYRWVERGLIAIGLFAALVVLAAVLWLPSLLERSGYRPGDHRL